MIKAVLFDLGGVYFEDGSNKFLKLLEKMTGKNYEELHAIFREGKSIEYRKNKISGKIFFKYAADKLNAGLAPDELNKLWVSQYTEVKGIRKLITELKKNGIKVTILSDNVPERIKFLESKYHFLSLFDDVVLSYEVNLTKASPEMFKIALSRIDVNPKEAVFVDDRDVNFKTARKLGIKSLLFTSVQKLRNELNRIINYN